jgi:hypothetical protein
MESIQVLVNGRTGHGPSTLFHGKGVTALSRVGNAPRDTPPASEHVSEPYPKPQGGPLDGRVLQKLSELALANQAANGRPVRKSSKASQGKCTHSASAAEFTEYRRASDAVGECERLDLLQDDLEDRITVCGKMQTAFESICCYDCLFT